MNDLLGERCPDCGGDGCDECGGCGEIPARCCHCNRVLLTRRERHYRACVECMDAQREDLEDDR